MVFIERSEFVKYTDYFFLILMITSLPSCIFNYPRALSCEGSFKATESQLMIALDKFFEVYPGNLERFETIQEYAQKDTVWFGKYYNFKVTDSSDTLYKIGLMKAYYKRNAIPPALGRPRYNWSVMSDDRKMRFSFSISNCLADTKVSYSSRKPNICLLCLTSASYKEEGTNKFKPIDYSREAKGKKRLAIEVFEADILPKIEKIISTEK